LSGIDVSEANAEMPRKVRIDDDTITGLGFALFFSVLWLVPAAWGAYDDIRDSHVRDTLRREGHQADGEVVKSYAGRGSVDVIYRFSVDGFWYPGRAKIIADDYKVQAPGEKIPIRYLPKDPRVNQPVDWGWFSVWWMIFYSLGLGLLVATGAIFIAGLRKRELARIGFVVEGRVTGSTPDRSRFKVYYEFTTEDIAYAVGIQFIVIDSALAELAPTATNLKSAALTVSNARGTLKQLLREALGLMRRELGISVLPTNRQSSESSATAAPGS